MALMKMPTYAGGGSLTEETLWTNSSPTSNYTNTPATLSKSIQNYEYVGIYWKISTSVATSSFVMVKVSEFVNMTTTGTINVGLAAYAADSNVYLRAARYNSNTEVGFGQCWRSSAATADNAYCIPTKIVGMK